MNNSSSVVTDTDELRDYELRNTLESRCPHLAKFDPAMADPYPMLREIREQAPVFFIPEHDVWCVTRHQDLLEIYRDPISYSNIGAHDMRVPLPPAIVADVGPDYHFPFQGQLNTIDPPDHTRIRKLMQKAFTPRHISGREGDIRALVNGLVDRFVDDGRVELVSAYTSPIPVNVVAMIMGMTQEDARQFRGWVDAFFALSGATNLPEEEATRHWAGLIAFERFTRAFIAERRESPADDLTSALIHTRSDDGSPSLTDDEVLAQILGILAAGSDTTSILIAKTLHSLLTEPERWEEVRGDAGLVPQAIEEGLRLRSPIRGLRRRTTTEVELGGVKIPSGAKIYIHIASANRDQAVFTDAEEYELHRHNVAEHLGLGKWAHFCIGAVLARLEARIALETLIERIPRLRLTPGQDTLEFDYNLIVPALRKLDVEWR
jgi:cytochrome P450